MKIERLENEEFRLIPNTNNYYVSNMGRAMKVEVDSKGGSKESLLSVIRSRNCNGKYYHDIYVKFKNDKRTSRVRLGRCIAAAWKDSNFGILFKDDKRVVDYRDNDSENNKLENIRILTQSENLMSALYEQNKEVSIPKKRCYARKGDDYREYDSTNMLVRDISNCKNAGMFNHAVKYKHKLNGYEVGYLD